MRAVQIEEFAEVMPSGLQIVGKVLQDWQWPVQLNPVLDVEEKGWNVQHEAALFSLHGSPIMPKQPGLVVFPWIVTLLRPATQPTRVP
jgi:hypothetical protein